MSRKPQDAPPSIEDFLAHQTFLRNLASDLVADPVVADDLVQETWLYVLTHPLRHASNLRGWLRATTRHRLPRRARDRRAGRTDLERVWSADGRATDDHAAAREVRAQLAQAVRRLREPYRTVVMLRYFEQRSPSDIARRLERPLNTVNAQLRRGLRLLRTRLDERSGGDRTRWSNALVAACALRRTGAPAEAHRGATEPRVRRPARLATGPPVIGAAGALLAGLAGTFAWWAAGGARAGEVDAGPPARVAATAPAAAADPAGSAPDRRSAHAVREAPPSASEPSERGARHERVRGRVLDLEGRPVGGLEVAFEPGTFHSGWHSVHEFRPDDRPEAVARATSAADGGFELALAPGARGRFVARGEGYVPAVAEVRLSAEPRREERTLLVAPRRAVRGRVVHRDGTGVGGVRVGFKPDALSTDAVHDPAAVVPHAVTDPSGRFEIADAFECGTATVDVRRGALVLASTAVGPADGEIELVLLAHAGERLVEARVIDREGAPVPEALISLDGLFLRTDERGRLRFPVGAHARPQCVQALAPGAQPASADLADGGGGTSGAVTLRLGAPPRTLRGRVVDASGAPVPRARVWLRDPTPFCIEPWPLFVESMLSAAEHELSPATTADAEGRFELDGLLDREYRLTAVQRETLALVTSDPVRAGATDVVLELPTAGPRASLRGRVVTPTGAPLAGVRIAACSHLVRAELPWRDGPFELGVDGGSAETDADGRFELPPLRTRDLFLRATGSRVFPTTFEVERDAPQLERELVVPLRASIRLDAPPGGPADGFRLYGADGEPLPIMRRQEGLVHVLANLQPRGPLGAPGRALWDVPQTAVELALLAGETELHRIALELDAGRLNAVAVPSTWPGRAE